MINMKLKTERGLISNAGCLSGPVRFASRDSPPLGQQLDRWRMKHFVLTEALHAPESAVPPHIHRAASLTFIIRGSSVECFEDSRLEAEPGGLLLRPAGELHSDRFGQRGAQLLTIEIDSNYAASVDGFGKVFQRPSYFSEGVLPSLAQRIYHESKTRDTAAELIIEGLMLEMLGTVSRNLRASPFKAPTWLAEAKKICNEQFRESLHLSQIAETIGVHPTHLARSFKKVNKLTLGEYVRQLRIDWAAGELVQTNDSITDLAVAAGFYDESHFIRTFKKQFGVSPHQYRSLNRR